MPRDRYDSRYQRYDADDWDDEYDDDEDEGEYADDGYSRALVAYGESEYLPAYESQEYGAIIERPDPVIIPGAGLAPSMQGPRRKRPLSMQLLVTSVTVCLVLAAFFSFVPLNDVAAATFGGPIDTLSNSINFSRQGQFWLYRAHPGETFESMAASLGVNEKGIFELNNLYADAEIQVGQVYKIPYDPNFGANFRVPLPPGLNQCGYYNGLVNVIDASNGYLFCASGGKDNGTSGICDTLGQSAGNNPTLFGLQNPLINASPAIHWVRGFTNFHSGIDLSNGVYGTKEYAVADGTVIFAKYDVGGGGFSVKENLCNGLAVSYSHLEYIPNGMVVGKNIHKGDLIGLMGNTGRSFGVHLHFMVWWDNIPFDALCVYGTLGGYTTTPGQTGGCPQSGMLHDAWWP